MKQAIKWATFDNAKGSRTIKQHAFEAKGKRDRITGIVYPAVRSLCGQVSIGTGPEPSESTSLEEIDAGILDEPNACKTCLSIYNKTHTKK